MVSSTVELDTQYNDLVVIGINEGEEPATVQSFADEIGMTYLNLVGDSQTYRAYRVQGHPQTVLIDSDGQVFRTYIGYTDKVVIEPDVRVLLGLE